jgi:four helix bundle protein
MAQPVSAERLRTLRLQERVFRFACGVVSQCPNTVSHLAAREIWRHLVAAVVSTANNLEEADEASSDADFVAKMKIALREVKEARRCIRFLMVCRLSQREPLADSEDEARQLAAIFATIVINTKHRLAREKAAPKKTRQGN